jgi:hypothetical protein
MGRDFVQAALSSSGDHIHCICSPIRTRVASLEPDSGDNRTARIIAVRWRLGVDGRIEAQWIRLHTFKHTSQEHRLVWVPSVFRGLPVFIHAIERDGAGSDGGIGGWRSAPTSGTREATGSVAATATTDESTSMLRCSAAAGDV